MQFFYAYGTMLPRKRKNLYKTKLRAQLEHERLAVHFLTLGCLYEAEHHFEEALQILPEDVDIRLHLALVKVGAGKFHEARWLLEEVQDKFSNYPYFRGVLGRVYLEIGISANDPDFLDLAETELEAAVDMQKRQLHHVFELGSVYLAQKRYRKALKCLHQVARTKSPQNADLKYEAQTLLCHIYQKLGNEAKYYKFLFKIYANTLVQTGGFFSQKML